MESRESGERLRRYVREHMARRDIGTFMELARRSDVGRDTLQAWFRGRRPTPQAGGKVAASLGVTYYEMLKEFDGAPDDFDPETMIRALEFAIQQVRAGKLRPSKSGPRQRGHSGGERTKEYRVAS